MTEDVATHGHPSSYPVALRNHRAHPAPWVSGQIAASIRGRFPERYWRRGSALVELRDGELHAVGPGDLLGPGEQAIDLVRVNARTGEESHYAPTRRQLVPLCQSADLYGFDEIAGVVHCPFVAPSGRLVTAPGFDSETGLWFEHVGDPIEPDGVDEDTLHRVLARLLDSSFRSDADRDHALGAYLLPILRSAIDGPTPLHLISAENQAAGKTYLADCIGRVLAGTAPMILQVEQGWSSELTRQLDAHLLTSPALTLLDNLDTDGTIGGASLHRYLTASGPVGIRPIGSGQQQRVRVRCMWMATANRPAVDSEQARRTVQIVLDNRPGRSYLSRDLRTWILDNRSLVLSVLCRLVRDWLGAGRPEPQRTLPSFEHWSRVVGGVVEHHYNQIGRRSQFLAPEAQPTPPEPEWAELAQLWPVDDEGPQWLPARRAVELVDDYDLALLQEAVSADRGGRGSSVRMARLLGALVERPQEAPGVHVERRKGQRHREYRVSLVAPAPTGEPGPRWKRELAAVAERGVEVDWAAWDAALLGAEALIEADPDLERRKGRRRSVRAYGGEVRRQAKRDPENRVRSEWRPGGADDPGGAWTGRISACQPPLQGITKLGELRRCVVPRAGHSFVVGDWRCSHLTIAAGRSGDAALLEVLAAGDPHQATAELLRAPRALGKIFNLASLNLAGSERIVQIARDSFGLDVDVHTAARLQREWWARFPQLTAWKDRLVATLPARWATPLFNRPIVVPVAKRYPSAVIAGVLQSLEADALLDVLEDPDDLMRDLGAVPVLLVHDEVVWEVPSELAEEAAARARRQMIASLAKISGAAVPRVEVEVRTSWSG